MEGLNEKGLAILLGPLLALWIMLIIVACLLAICICFGSVYCLMRYCISEDYEETQVVPISIVEKPTDSINQKWNSIYNSHSILSTMYQLFNPDSKKPWPFQRVSWDHNFKLGNLNRVSKFSLRCQLLYRNIVLSSRIKFEGFRLLFPIHKRNSITECLNA